jgi:hypothetical protein
MNPYRWLGAVSIAMLAVALGLAVYLITGRRGRRTTYLVSGTVLALMIALTVLCAVIYMEYGIPSK